MNTLTVKTVVRASIEKVWQYWTSPEHIVHWAFASDDWEVPAATNDLSVGGRFMTTMAAKDGTMSFDFTGTYTNIDGKKHIAYTIDDGRKVTVDFTETDDGVEVTETFEPERLNPEDVQRQGWQSILTNFKTYTESTEIL